MTKEHLGLALALKLPLVCVITKIDMCPEHILEQTLNDLQKILKVYALSGAACLLTRAEPWDSQSSDSSEE